MSEEGFDYGAEVLGGESFKNPEVGDHSARLRSIIHHGMFQETYNGVLKDPFNEVTFIFELEGADDVTEDGKPLEITKSFPLKKGKKATLTKMINVLDPKGVAKSFDDIIGNACQVSITPGKEVGEDGKPKYVNFGGISGIAAEFRDMVKPLQVKGVGHVRFANMTEEAILELHPIREVADIMMKGLNYKGSVAEEIINKLKEADPEFAVRKSKDDSDKKEAKSETPAKTEVSKAATESLSAEEDF